MGPEFDNLALQAVEAVTNLHGVAAVWHSSTGLQIPGRVLFKNPTEPVPIGDSEAYEYRPNSLTAEYYEGVFSGLKKSTDEGNGESLEINQTKYSVLEVTTKFDGKIYVVHLEANTD